jgi:chemotaxis methyl-accepting protein methylase
MNARETNTTTHFLRERRALEMIRDLVAIPNTDDGRRTVVWSVGCSTGDEPYSLAMLCREARCDVDIFATDINPGALERAQRGRYHERNLRHVDAVMRDRWFDHDGDCWHVAPELRSAVQFRAHDITRESAPRHDVDVALCRNVMVYFNAEQARHAVTTIAASLRPGALLILGASEWLRSDTRVRGTLQLVPMEKAGVIVYQRVDDVPLARPSPQPQPQPASQPARPAPVQPETPRIVDQLRILGDARLDAGHPVEARDCYEKALAHAPLLADLHLRIALSYLHARESRQAAEALRRALFLTPQLWQAWLLMADLAHEPAQARRYLDQARQLLETDRAVLDSPALRVFGPEPSVALAAIRHRLRGFR